MYTLTWLLVTDRLSVIGYRRLQVPIRLGPLIFQWYLNPLCLWIYSPTPVLWYQIPMADVPLPGLPNCSSPTATFTVHFPSSTASSCPVLFCLELSPITDFWSCVQYLVKYCKVKVSVKIISRPTVSRPVRPGVRPPLGPATNFSLCFTFSSDSCGLLFCGALYDERMVL
jgi:hypothetical protein